MHALRRGCQQSIVGSLHRLGESLARKHERVGDFTGVEFIFNSCLNDNVWGNRRQARSHEFELKSDVDDWEGDVRWEQLDAQSSHREARLAKASRRTRRPSGSLGNQLVPEITDNFTIRIVVLREVDHLEADVPKLASFRVVVVQVAQLLEIALQFIHESLLRGVCRSRVSRLSRSFDTHTQNASLHIEELNLAIHILTE